MLHEAPLLQRSYTFLKLFIFCIIQQRQEIHHCIVCGVGHDNLKSN